MNIYNTSKFLYSVLWIAALYLIYFFIIIPYAADEVKPTAIVFVGFILAVLLYYSVRRREFKKHD